MDHREGAAPKPGSERSALPTSGPTKALGSQIAPGAILEPVTSEVAVENQEARQPLAAEIAPRKRPNDAEERLSNKMPKLDLGEERNETNVIPGLVEEEY